MCSCPGSVRPPAAITRIVPAHTRLGVIAGRRGHSFGTSRETRPREATCFLNRGTVRGHLRFSAFPTAPRSVLYLDSTSPRGGVEITSEPQIPRAPSSRHTISVDPLARPHQHACPVDKSIICFAESTSVPDMFPTLVIIPLCEAICFAHGSDQTPRHKYYQASIARRPSKRCR